MDDPLDPSTLSNEQLLSTLDSLIACERKLVARVVRMLMEIEERRLHLELAYSSMFSFCTSKLQMSAGEAYRRIVAARLAQRFPKIIGLLESGAIHISALELLRDHLTNENHHELLSAASGKTKSEIEALIAARKPKPDAPSSIRKLPNAPSPDTSGSLLASPPAARPSDKPRIEPLSATRFKVQFTASGELKQKLDRARDLLSHANPSGDLAVIVERAIDVLLADLENSRRAKAKRPRPSGNRSRTRSPKRGRASRATRREVFERDCERCTYVGPDGKRCEATASSSMPRAQSALGGADVRQRVRRTTHPLAPAEVHASGRAFPLDRGRRRRGPEVGQAPRRADALGIRAQTSPARARATSRRRWARSLVESSRRAAASGAASAHMKLRASGSATAAKRAEPAQ
jgi:hypothetical protein